MTTELTQDEKEKQKTIMIRQSGDAVYGIGIFGAWAYYLSQATTPQEKVLGILKGFVWPAFLVFELFKFLNKEPE
jgi:hypothetical protein